MEALAAPGVAFGRKLWNLHPTPPPDSAMTKTDPALAQALEACATAPDAPRIQPLDHAGRRYWVKRVEVLPLRWRLQKGNPARGFQRERAALHKLAALGAPVPPVIAEGPDWFALPDCGETLESILATQDHPARPDAFAAAGAALAGLHGLGIAHGRPHPRDLCWDGARIWFLDFERGGRTGAKPRHRAFDVMQFVLALYSLTLAEAPEVEAFCAAYRAADISGGWDAATRWCRRLRWLDPLTRPIQRHERDHKQYRRYKEWQALPLTLARFGATASK